jgi:hypothetical protein
MNDTEYAEQKARLLALADWWIPKVGLGWWNIDMLYSRDSFEVHGEPAPSTLAKTSANWRYGHACIEWNMVRVTEQSDFDLEMAFVHELQHVFLNEARENGKDWLDHEERVASTYAKAFLWLRDALSEKPVEHHEPDQEASVDIVYGVAPNNGVSLSWTGGNPSA